MTQQLITRKQYMETGNELFVPGTPNQSPEYRAAKTQAHHDYTSQFVTEATIRHVLQRFSAEELVAAYAEDRHFNSLPLLAWDQLTWIPVDSSSFRGYSGNPSGPFYSTLPYDEELFKQADDYGTTRSDLVCIAKAAARIIVQRSTPSVPPGDDTQ